MLSRLSVSSAVSVLFQASPHSATTIGVGFRHERPAAHAQRHHHTVPVQPGIFFLISRAVKVCYGPYVVLGIMDYRTERLEGLKRTLERAGGEVTLVPSYHVNEVRVWHLEKEIFSCTLTDLDHGSDGEFDPVCKAAGGALEQSSRTAYFNLKHRYQLDPCLLTVCPCHDDLHENDSLARLPCRKIKARARDAAKKAKAEAEGNQG